MANTIVADSLTRRETSLPHNARLFAELPGRSHASVLLQELADAPCTFFSVPANRPIAIYGAGNLGCLAHDFLKMAGHDVILAVDRHARELAGHPDWSGVRLIHPDEATSVDKTGARLVVSVVTMAYVPIERSLLDCGFTDVVPFYDLAESFRDRHPLSNGWFAPPLTAEDAAITTRVLANWEDDASRAHHLQFIAWRRLREEWSFEPAPPSPAGRYFIPEVSEVLREDEILLDGGAHHGSAITAFLGQTKHQFQQIFAVEPDAFNRAQLEATFQNVLPNDERITIYDYALADHNGEAHFYGGLNYASQLSTLGGLRVTTRTIDALAVSPTIIKLHLEGGELAALKGARQTLLNCRPIVMATIYHNEEGIWKTAVWLMQMLPRYRFLFRNHSWCGTGAVIYAIPYNRGTR
jgi:FkbM family methyltransferase